MIKFRFLFLAVLSVYGRVIEKDEDVSNILTVGDSKIVQIKVVDDNNLTNNDNHVTDINTSNTCLNINDDNAIDTNDPLCEPEVKVDNGTALLLTPFIKEGRINEARNASKVDSRYFLGVESYSGFLTVNETYKSHMFFWYFPALKPGNDTPWIIWLQGGPGASSMTGLFDEIGPFSVRAGGNLVRNHYTWLQNHSLVFIDNPVGAGYSFTEHEDGYVQDMATYAKHLHEATKQLVQIFPELRVAPLYVAGESYAGKYVPALGMEIHRHKHAPGGDINFKGLIIGNAYVDPGMITDVVRPFYHFGLIEQEQLDSVKPIVDSFRDDIANNRSVEAKQKWNTIISIFLTMSYQRHAYNFLHDELPIGYYASYLSVPEVKRAIHVGDIHFSVLNLTVNQKLAPEFLTSAKPLFEELLEHYRVLAYCGQLDQMLSCAYSSENFRKWNWSGNKDFIEAPRHPYLLNRRLAGYYKSGGSLSWAVIRGAGHMVPLDTPSSIHKLVTEWTHSQPMSLGPAMNLNFMMQRANSTTVYL